MGINNCHGIQVSSPPMIRHLFLIILFFLGCLPGCSNQTARHDMPSNPGHALNHENAKSTRPIPPPQCDCSEMAAEDATAPVNRWDMHIAVLPEDRTESPITEMNYTNRGGHSVSGVDLIGKPLVLSFIYTRCENQSRCPLVTRMMHQYSQSIDESSLAGEANVAIVTFDPLYDTPPVLSTYGQEYGISEDSRCLLLRPEPAMSHAFFSNINMPVNFESSGRPNVHGTLLLILDNQGRIAHRYEVQLPEANTVMDHLASLLAE